MLPAKNLINWIDKEIDRPKTKLVYLAILAGVTNGLLLSIVNHATNLLSDGPVRLHYLFFYIIILAVFIYSQHGVLSKAVLMIEEGLRKVRTRIANKIRLTELVFVEKIGYNYVYNALSQDSIFISQGATNIFKTIMSAILVVFIMLYIAFLSKIGFMIGAVSISLAIWFFLTKQHAIMERFDQSRKKDVMFFDIFEETFSGFKEIKINNAKSRDLFVHQRAMAEDAKHYKELATISEVYVLSFSEIFFYTLLAVVIFIWPFFTEVSASLIVKISVSYMFLIIGPLNWVFTMLPILSKVESSVINLQNLEEKLDKIIKNHKIDHADLLAPPLFRSIRLENVRFEYLSSSDEIPFSLGPVNLELRRDEILFIVGNNGSGKSTLLKILVGLYYPTEGTIFIDDVPVDKDGYTEYREHFSTVFSDFHLFSRLYGVEDVDEEQIRILLKRMGLDNNTKFLDGQFTNINLSTGQRKRLAYIAALLDNKQIYVFDEWAADQDPDFRKYFYDVLLPDLRNSGKTIIAVSHDDRFFYASDRAFKLENGVLIQHKP
ncbi:MAG: cyclic peptide export ABC transporter [Magnetococcus sp. DMHC-1]|nr:cyclic peptide export ABC transporter [Magnetococcales bacterium]